MSQSHSAPGCCWQFTESHTQGMTSVPGPAGLLTGAHETRPLVPENVHLQGAWQLRPPQRNGGPARSKPYLTPRLAGVPSPARPPARPWPPPPLRGAELGAGLSRRGRMRGDMGECVDTVARHLVRHRVAHTVPARPVASGFGRNSQTCPLFPSNSPNVSWESDDESGAGLRRATLP